MMSTSQSVALPSCSPLEPHVPGRRTALRALTGAAAVLALGGCGFALRQAPKFAFDAVGFTGLANTPVSLAVQRALSSSGVLVARGLIAGQQPSGPSRPVVLNVLVDQRERVVAGQSNAGQVRELTLKSRFQYVLSTPNGKVLQAETELALERDISFSETDALAKAIEEDAMFSDMEGDIVQQVLRRLAAAQSL